MTISLLKEIAARSVAQYPQYANHFDNYVAVRIKRDIRTKMGLAFQKGEIAIARPEQSSYETRGGQMKAFRTVWSAKNEVDTSVLVSHVDTI